MEAILASIVAAAAPLVYVTVGETITEKAGVINLSLEGSLRLAAMAAFAAALTAGNPLVGFVVGAAVGAALAGVIAFGSIELKLNQIAVGFVLAVLGVALAIFLGDSYVGERGEQVTAWPVPLLSDIPILGRVIFTHNVSVYGSFLLIAVAWYFIYRTRWGLELQGIGERPEGAHARGVAVNKLRYLYTMVGGALVGVGGAAYSLDVKLGWRENLTLNLGWIALGDRHLQRLAPHPGCSRLLSVRRSAGDGARTPGCLPRPFPGVTPGAVPIDDPHAGGGVHRHVPAPWRAFSPIAELPFQRASQRHRDGLRNVIGGETERKPR